MSHTVPAIRSSMGSTDYFQSTMSARELAAVAKTAGELEEWSTWSIFERFQRDLNVGRVRREIVPYLVRTRDRFFGALIVLVFEPEVFEFEPMVPASLPAGHVYGRAASKMGFLTIDGGSLVVLDGQHRLVSLREVVNAGNELTGPFRDDVADDELSVMFIRHESFEKTRRIFNKVNRYAKPTSASDNIITSEDDGYSIVTRWLVENDAPLGLVAPSPPLSALDRDGEPLVEWRLGQLKITSEKFTTLTHLYQTVEHILAAEGMDRFGERHTVNRPPDADLERAYRSAARWWQLVIDSFDCYSEALERPSSIQRLRASESPHSLLFRPAVQVALFHGLSLAVQRGLQLEEAVQRAALISWQGGSEVWVGIIIGSNGKMKTRAEAIRRTGRLIEYLIAADLMAEAEMYRLEADLRDEADPAWYTLPQPVV